MNVLVRLACWSQNLNTSVFVLCISVLSVIKEYNVNQTNKSLFQVLSDGLLGQAGVDAAQRVVRGYNLGQGHART